jgi:hypothetical protein
MEEYRDINGFVKKYNSGAEASRETGIQNSNISACCRNKKHVHTAGGYK